MGSTTAVAEANSVQLAIKAAAESENSMKVLMALQDLRKHYEPEDNGGTKLIERSKALDVLSALTSLYNFFSGPLAKDVAAQLALVETNDKRRLFQWNALYELINAGINELLETVTN